MCFFFTLFTDDEPEDGPQTYVLILGFYQPPLVAMLNNVGIHVSNIIKLHSDDIQVYVDEQKQLLAAKESVRPNHKTPPAVTTGEEISLGGVVCRHSLLTADSMTF